MMIFSVVTESASKKAFSSTATMRLVAAWPASSRPRSIQPWWFLWPIWSRFYVSVSNVRTKRKKIHTKVGWVKYEILVQLNFIHAY
jgi:hypothetical protein